jgi:hypothetical protein
VYRGNGYVFETGIPFSALAAGDDSVFRFNAVTVDGDVKDTFTFARPDRPSTWMLIKKENR